MAGSVGHTGGLTNPRPCRAGYSKTGGPPLPRKRAPCQKNQFGFSLYIENYRNYEDCAYIITWSTKLGTLIFVDWILGSRCLGQMELFHLSCVSYPPAANNTSLE